MTSAMKVSGVGGCYHLPDGGDHAEEGLEEVGHRETLLNPASRALPHPLQENLRVAAAEESQALGDQSFDLNPQLDRVEEGVAGQPLLHSGQRRLDDQDLVLLEELESVH